MRSAVWAAGLALSLSLYLVIEHREEDRIRLAFHHRAATQHALLGRQIDRYVELLLSLRSFFDFSEEVSRAEFSGVAADLRLRTPGIQALEWVPRVPAAERTAYEERARREGLAGFEFKDRTAAGSFVRASERAEYLPIYFAEPIAGNEPVLGYDVALAKTRNSHDQARMTGRPIGSPPLVLAQETQGQLGWVVSCVVTAPGGGDASFRGYVQGVFRLPDLLAAAQVAGGESGLDLLVLDLTPDSEHRVLHRVVAQDANSSEEQFRQGMYEELDLPAAGRRWTLLIRPSTAWLRDQKTAFPAGMAGAALLLTALLASYVGQLASQNDSVKMLVAARTAELEKSRTALRRLATAVEQSTEIIVMLDPAGLVSYVNRAFERSTGAAGSTVLGRHVDEWAQAEAERPPFEKIAAIIEERGVWNHQLTTHRADGSTFIADLMIYPVREGAGALENYIVVARDVTKEAELEQQLRTSQKMEAVGLLAGGIAHDFNNLLHVIHGFAELAMGDSEPRELRDNLEQITDAVERAAQLTRQLLVFGRGEPESRTDVDLRDVTRELLKMLRRLIGEHIAVEFAPPATLGNVHADKGQLEQVLLNLCLNARDAMPEGGRLRLALSDFEADEDLRAPRPRLGPGQYVRLTVADTGSGMSPATLERIYEPFFTTKPQGEGTGLGLSVVYSIVKQHGGGIEVSSSPGSGTTFTIYLPVQMRTQEPAAAVPFEAQRGGAETILIAEDEVLIRALAQHVLESVGYEVLTAADGVEACQLFETEADRIALVILDARMPRMGGREAAEKMRLRKLVPMLFSSGHTAGTLPSLADLGPDTELLCKPYSPSELVAKVREILDRNRTSAVATIT